MWIRFRVRATLQCQSRRTSLGSSLRSPTYGCTRIVPKQRGVSSDLPCLDDDSIRLARDSWTPIDRFRAGVNPEDTNREVRVPSEQCDLAPRVSPRSRGQWHADGRRARFGYTIRTAMWRLAQLYSAASNGVFTTNQYRDRPCCGCQVHHLTRAVARSRGLVGIADRVSVSRSRELSSYSDCVPLACPRRTRSAQRPRRLTTSPN